jgi:hypothetical protein
MYIAWAAYCGVAVGGVPSVMLGVPCILFGLNWFIYCLAIISHVLELVLCRFIEPFPYPMTQVQPLT